MIPNDMKHQYARNVLAVEDLRRQEESWIEDREEGGWWLWRDPEETEPAACRGMDAARPPEEAA